MKRITYDELGLYFKFQCIRQLNKWFSDNIDTYIEELNRADNNAEYKEIIDYKIFRKELDIEISEGKKYATFTLYKIEIYGNNDMLEDELYYITDYEYKIFHDFLENKDY